MQFWIQFSTGVAMGCLLLVLTAACGKDIKENEPIVFNTEVETVKDVEIFYSDSAHVRVKIAGPTMLNHLDKNNPMQEFTDGVAVDFFGADGKITSKLTAKYGIRYEGKSEVVVRDSVIWESLEREKLETEELTWDEKSKKVYTNKFVVITRPDEIIYGHGFEANQDFSYSRINAIEGRIKVADLEKEIE
ncbi:MAG TPA: LPS export ABC transporter periplasmic protein LptC [Saprospiraceae bacterium]|nr:LPS export ABC transporter periplasmic protein LptC [Saprospiraceae bacterium]HMQ82332.1 LPS export ABC transporter periplasmic protein LptC [Saprospiraceae bacterium]